MVQVENQRIQSLRGGTAVLHNWKRLAVSALGAAMLVFIANPVLAAKGGGGGGRGGGGRGGGTRSAGFRGGPSGMSRGWGGGGNWNGRGNFEGRGWGREGDWGREGWARGGWGWWGPGLWGWGGGYYNPWYDDGYGYGGYATGGYPPDYSSFYSGPATYSEDTQGYAGQGPAGSMMANEDAAMIAVRVPPNADIWFDGQKTNQKGAVRQFETPALDPGHDYAYEVRARWNENGRNIEAARGR